MISSKGDSRLGLGLHKDLSVGGKAGPAWIVADAGRFSWPSNLGQSKA